MKINQNELSVDLIKEVTVERILLEKIRMMYWHTIPEGILRNLKMEILEDYENHHFRVLLETVVLGKKIREEVEESVILYPTWWEHFKADYFPRWLRMRFPVKSKYKPVTIRHYHTCPHLDTEDNHSRMAHILFLKGEESEMPVRE